MPRRSTKGSIAELRRQLAAKERQVEKLMGRRGKFLARVGAIDKLIAAIGGEVPAPAGPGRRKAGRPGRKPAAGGIVRRRARTRATGRPLVDYIADVLKGRKEGMRVKDVMAAVTQAGYASASKDFYGIVAAALRDSSKFKNLRRGVYALA